MEAHEHHGENHTGHLLMLGGAGAVGGLIAAPYVLPFFHIGEAGMVGDIMHFIGGHASAGMFGHGLAGAVQGGIASVPLVGGALTSTAPVAIPGLGVSIAAGALTTIAASAFIGIGGMMLANWMEKHEKDDGKIHWSKIIRWTSLATSILVSLPSILTGISIGVTFLAAVLSPLWGSYAATAMQSTLGATSMTMGAAEGAGALSGFAAMLPHLFTCGPALLPVVLAMFGGKKHDSHEHDAHHNKTEATATAELVSTSPTIAGQPCELAFRLRDKTTGRVLSCDDLTTTHTKKLHTMIVDSALSDYHHLHPTYDSARGLFVAQFTPATNHPYMAWHDFTPYGADRVVARNELPASPHTVKTPPFIVPKQTASAEGVTINLSTNKPMCAGSDCMLTVQLRDASRKPVTDLEPVMGASAHLVGFSRDGQHFIHCHPMSEAAGQMQFHISPEQEGLTQFFLQIRRGGHDIYIPFGQRIQPPQQFTARENTRMEHVHHMMV